MSLQPCVVGKKVCVWRPLLALVNLTKANFMSHWKDMTQNGKFTWQWHLAVDQSSCWQSGATLTLFSSKNRKWTQRWREAWPLRWHRTPVRGGHRRDKHALSPCSCILKVWLDLNWSGQGCMHPHLHQNSPAQFGFDQRFGYPAGSIGGGAVHLWEVFAGESPASVSSPASVRVDDDFPACNSSVTLFNKKKPEISKYVFSIWTE